MDAACLPTDELIDQVLTWAARVARGDAELVVLIGEMDTRQAWAEHGVSSCAQWLSWKLGWCRTTSRERVRVGRALRELPVISAAFLAGRVTYSQVRAITRVATADDEQSWLELARHCTGEQLDKAARGAARALAADRDPAEQPATPPVRKEWDEHGDLILTLRIPAHQAVPVLLALEQLQAVEQTERDEQLAALMTDLAASGASAEALAGQQLELPTPSSAPVEQPVDAAGASAEAPTAATAVDLSAVDPGEVDLSAVPAARYLDPLEHYPYSEPPFPIHPDRMFSTPTAGEQQRIERWRQRRDHERAIRDAWNDRREQLLIAASARKLATGRASLADALVRAVLRPTECPPVTVLLLHDPVSGWVRTPHHELLPPATLSRLLDTLPRKRTRRAGLAVPTGPTGCNQGRTGRVASHRLLRLLGALDGERCRFPGCPHTRHLKAHHVRFWSAGGPTDLANMILLCSRHHQLLHVLGYLLTLDADRNLTVTTADGTDVRHQPELRPASGSASHRHRSHPGPR